MATPEEILKEVGNWLKINGESIYETTSSPLGKFNWGRCTKKVNNGNTILYLSIFNWPESGVLILPQIKNKVIEATLLSNGKSFKTTSSKNGLQLTLPKTAPDKYASVIKVKMKGIVKIEKSNKEIK